ncbi:hypothetical protein TNCV_4550961 [Trichonephila clavipes]|uniref:Uncharacterized protein n=1 Tax=Trichonephila clavipes TaxID=2585209 RepID=A0A8X6VDS8_TRICX|nr:hypothetical protein TNCV_4550961 [Trichonephila clavipes]
MAPEGAPTMQHLRKDIKLDRFNLLRIPLNVESLIKPEMSNPQHSNHEFETRGNSTATSNRIAPSHHSPVPHRTCGRSTSFLIAPSRQHRVLIDHHPDSAASFIQSGGTSSNCYYCPRLASSCCYFQRLASSRRLLLPTDINIKDSKIFQIGDGELNLRSNSQRHLAYIYALQSTFQKIK